MTIAATIRTLLGKPYRTVSAARAAELVESGAVLLDVRAPHEWKAGHAPRARHIPLGELDRRIDQLPAGRPIITVCRSGARSARAAALLAGQGREVSNLAGGMSAWVRADLPVVAKGGRPGRIS